MFKKSDCNTKTTEIENIIHNATGLVTNDIINTKATEIENKIPDVSTLVTKAFVLALVTAKTTDITIQVTKTTLKEETFKKYVRSRFPSFDPPPPLFALVCFRAPHPPFHPPSPKVHLFWQGTTHPSPPQFLYLWNLEKRN